MSQLKGNVLEGISYTVFGCGSHEWPRTYQRIPQLIDDTLSARGALRLMERGVGDSAAVDFFEAFDRFEETLWEMLKKVTSHLFTLLLSTLMPVKHYSISANQESPPMNIQVKTVSPGTSRAAVLRLSATLAEVVSNQCLTPPNAPIRHHIRMCSQFILLPVLMCSCSV
jgi:cytochrome P450 / NADPH-cytochrome P450 reductase